MMRTNEFFCFFLLVSYLTGCGFTLRGNDVINSHFSELQLNLAEPNSQISRLLRRSLEVSDVSTQIVSGSDEQILTSSSPTLSVSNEQISTRPITVTPRARAAQYEMRLSVTISLQESNQILIEPEALFVDRVYFEDIENIAGNREEVEIITTEMRRELVNQIMRRLETAD